MKRLFFGLEPILPSLDLQQGRLLQEKDRHHTLVFLGNKEANKVIDYLNNFFTNPLLFSPLATNKIPNNFVKRKLTSGRFLKMPPIFLFTSD
jgi:hypothetical protein